MLTNFNANGDISFIHCVVGIPDFWYISRKEIAVCIGIFLAYINHSMPKRIAQNELFGEHTVAVDGRCIYHAVFTRLAIFIILDNAELLQHRSAKCCRSMHLTTSSEGSMASSINIALSGLVGISFSASPKTSLYCDSDREQ